MSNQPVNPVDFAKAIADETRQQIMRLCCCRWMNVGEIVEALEQPVSQPTVSHHLGLLKAAGLVKVRRQGKQVYYTLNQGRIVVGCCTLAEDFAPECKVTLELPEEN